MKNMKVKKKLFVSLGILVLLGIVVAVGGTIGMSQLNGQIITMNEKTLPNTRRVDVMQRNLQAEVNELLLALTSIDSDTTDEYLKTAKEKIKQNEDLLKIVKAETTIDQALITQLESDIAAQETVRAEYRRLVELNTEDGNMRAMKVMTEELIPLLVNERDTLEAISQAQTDITNQRVDQAETLYKILLITMVSIVIVALVISIIIAKKLMDAILTPLDIIKNGVQEFEHGNFDADVAYDSRDEFGETCVAMYSCQKVLKTVVEDACYLLGEMADGNFAIRSRARDQYVGGLKPMIESIAAINQKLSDTLSQIDLGAEQVAAGADQVSTGAQALAQGATEQASAVEELSATINEISTNAKKNAEYSVLAREHSKEAGGYVTESADDVKEMVVAMKQISDSSQEISKIIGTIEQIAFQTNILALNAAVEAARAGVAGKGFAVVADEVRNLAAKSDDAAKATKELISSSIDSVKQGDVIVQRVAASLESTMGAARQAEDDIEHIAKAIQEEAEAVAQVTEGIDQISSVVQTNSATSEESAAASEELSSQAALMKDLMSRFTLREGASGYTAPAAVREPVSSYEDQAPSVSGVSSFDKY